MKPERKLLARGLPALFCLLAIILAACGGGTTAPTADTKASDKAPDSKQVLLEPAYSSQLRTLDPPVVPDEGAIGVDQLLYSGLVEVDDQLNVHLQMAASYTLSPDGLQWTFKLKPNLKFSDGTAITSQDVAYSIDRALKPSLKGPNFSYQKLIKDSDQRFAGKIPTLIGDSLLVPDPQTLVIITNAKAAYFLDTLTFPTSFVVEKSMIDKYGDVNYTNHLSEGGCSGPWILSRTDSKTAVFTPNPYYYGPHPQLKKLVLVFYPQVDTAYKAFQTGQLDGGVAVPTAQIASAKALPDGQLHQVPQLTLLFIHMNYLIKPFDNTKIRQAFALALDKEAIAHDVWKDTEQPTNHLIPKGQPGYFPDLVGTDGTTSTKGNPAKAKELFTEGLQEEGMTLATLPPIIYTYASVGSADVRNEIAVEQQMWQNVLGVTVKPNDIDINKFFADLQTNAGNPKGFMLWNIGWAADYPDPQDWTTNQFTKGSSLNYENYGQNSSTDVTQQNTNQQLMLQADTNSDPAARQKQYNQVEQQMVTEAALIATGQTSAFLVYKPCVKGVIDNPQGPIPPDDWAQLYKTTSPNCADTSAY